MLTVAGAVILAGEEPAEAGPLGFFVVLALGVATVLLIRSMGRHLRRIPPSFDAPDDARRDDDPGDAEDERQSGS